MLDLIPISWAFQDYYDVSLVDGYNIPVFIEPIEGTYSTNGGDMGGNKGRN